MKTRKPNWQNILLALALTFGLMFGAGNTAYAKPNSSLNLNELNWSVQYMIDQSQTVLGNSQFTAPRDNRGLALSPDGRYLYAGYNNGPEVRKIDLTQADYTAATIARTTASRGKAIAVDDQGRVYLAEGGSIKVLDADLSAVQYTISGAGLVTKCEGIAVQREGGILALYATERGGPNTLTRWVLTESGSIVTGASPAGLDGDGIITVAGASDMRGVAIDSAGRIWIADPSATIGNGKVFRLDNDGTNLVSNTSVPNPYAIAFNGDEVLVTGGYQRVISVLNMDDLSVVDTIIPPWSSLELDLDGNSSNGSLTGIVVTPDGFYVTNEAGQTANEKSTYGIDDGNSGDVDGKHYTDLTHDDNDPILFATNPPPASPNATITIHVHTGVAPGTGQAGYRVHVYNPGGSEIAWKDTSAGGDAAFLLNNGNYEYSIEKNGSYSARQSFTVAGIDTTVNYQLSSVTIKVGDHQDGVHQGYRVHVYRAADAGGGEWAWQDSDANGLTTFYMVDGSYSYKVEKNASYSATKNFDVVYLTDYDLEFLLSKVTVTIGDHQGGLHQGYRVHVYRAADAGGGEWAWQDSDANGLTTFYMVDGSYSYKVEKNASYSATKNFDVVYLTDYDLEFLLSKVTVTIGDHQGGLHQGYRVHVYRAADAGGGEWAWQDSDANGLTTFYMVDGSYSYKVEKNSSYSTAKNFDVVYSNDYNLEYKLSKVVVKVTNKAGQVLASYRVHVYRAAAGGGGEWAWQDSDASGLTTFYMVDGSYSYKVEKGCYWSVATDFTVVYSNDLSLTHKATVVATIKVGDHFGGYHDGYLVRVFAAGGGELANAWSAGGGLATFELDALGNYEYRVEKSGAVGPKKPFQLCVSQTIEYKLSKVEIKVGDHFGGGHAGYLVRVFNAGAGEWGNAWSNASGLTTFWLIEGSYEYRIEKNGAIGPKLPFTVVYSHDYNGDPDKDSLLEYKLSRVIIKVTNKAGQSLSGYLVRVFNAGAGEWGNAWSDANGLTTYWLIEGGYEYRLEKGCYTSDKSPFTVVYSNDYTLVKKAIQNITIKVGDNLSTGHSGYLVRVYKTGGSELANQWSNGSGLTSFDLDALGSYQYVVEKNGAKSAKKTVTTQLCSVTSLEYKLATVTVKASDTANVGHSGYLVRVYNNGAGEWGNAWSNSGGMTTFYLIEGNYEYLIEKNGAKSQKYDFSVAVPAPNADNKGLEYDLAKVTVKASDTANVGHSGYLVRIYNNGAGEWGNAWTNGGGLATFYLIEGNYAYLIEKNGAKSARYDFTVDPPTSADNQDLEYKLAMVTVKASDTANVGHSGYLVRIYNDGASEWGNAWTNGGGLATFYLIEGNYEYLIEKNGAKSAKYDFSLAAPAPNADDKNLEYDLAKITVKASDTANVGHSGYLVRIYNNGAGEWGNAWTNGGGLATFYLIEGNYEYLIEKNGAKSAKYDFTVDPPTSADNQDLEYKLATVTVKASDTTDVGHSGYLVRVYNNGAGEWGNAWTSGGGLATFYLIEGNYEYLIEKNGAKSAKYDFNVAAPAPNANDKSLEYELAKVVIHVQNSGGNPLSGYLARIYNYPTTTEWGNAWTNGSGDAVFYLIEGGYQYQVEKNGSNSDKLPIEGFTIVAPPPGNNQTLNHTVP